MAGPALPYDLTNGTDADATQVMANFEYLFNLIESIVGQPLIAAQAMSPPLMVGLNNAGEVVPASNTGIPAIGFLSAAVAQGAVASIAPIGPASGFSGLTLGDNLFLSSSGGVSTAPPAIDSGLYVQQVGWAASTTTIYFQPQEMSGPL